jgi:ammonia channel protein AmtB
LLLKKASIKTRRGSVPAGAGMRWVGWFGFNGGNALAAAITQVHPLLMVQKTAD